MLNELAKEVFQNAKNKGFHDTEHNIGQMLCLIHSEVSEALEAHRVDKFAIKSHNMTHNIDLDQLSSSPSTSEILYFKQEFSVAVKNSFEDELADVIIRVLDLCAYKNIDIDKHVRLKMLYNSFREHKHGKNY